MIAKNLLTPITSAHQVINCLLVLKSQLLRHDCVLLKWAICVTGRSLFGDPQ